MKKGRDSEDDLYDRFRTSEGEEHDLVLEKLHEKLFRHGLAVAYIVLHEHRPDIAAAACAEVICYPYRFKGTAKFTTYFEKIVRNMCRRALREKIEDRANVPIDDLDLESHQFEKETQPKLFIDRISRDLDPESQTLIKLKLIGTPDAEIGEKLGINTEAVKARWYRLKKTLAKQVGETTR